ncbi:MAG: MBL fold metallo-hydrolase [Lachnospiraceae bacterium]|nr:MBL fold metallo-hydrolase [Lachnospiraceae bacterium]MBD5483430.1 MBL fold metallo-hydrolase [Lachnospiraceae bacterium]
MVIELKYSGTNTYLIRGTNGSILFDTGWAGSFPQFCRALGEAGATAQEIRYLFISHFHPDHMGIAQEIAGCGARIVVADVQRAHIHEPDRVFAKEGNRFYLPIADEDIRVISCGESRLLLKECGIAGEVVHTPGHSEDSITLCLDEGLLFVGDLNPLYELDIHRGTQIEDSWNKLLVLNPIKVYYGHAKAVELSRERGTPKKESGHSKDMFRLVKKIMKYIDKGYTMEDIGRATGADKVFLEDVARMYLTHRGISVQGILDRIEIKGK